jgi:hypothetical protein
VEAVRAGGYISEEEVGSSIEEEGNMDEFHECADNFNPPSYSCTTGPRIEMGANRYPVSGP